MQVDVNLDADTVNKMVTDAILGSVIGDRLREVVTKQVETIGTGYNDPVKLAVEREVQLLVNNIVNEQFKPMIEAKVRELVTDQLMSDIALASWRSLMANIEKIKHY